jgi:hypothetical protein
MPDGGGEVPVVAVVRVAVAVQDLGNRLLV